MNKLQLLLLAQVRAELANTSQGIAAHVHQGVSLSGQRLADIQLRIDYQTEIIDAIVDSVPQQ
jgi:hypothetical protein